MAESRASLETQEEVIADVLRDTYLSYYRDMVVKKQTAAKVASASVYIVPSYFDAKTYLARYPDVKAAATKAGGDPVAFAWKDYVDIGQKAGRSYLPSQTVTQVYNVIPGKTITQTYSLSGIDGEGALQNLSPVLLLGGLALAASYFMRK